jgi:dienelactone hydrolase
VKSVLSAFVVLALALPRGSYAVDKPTWVEQSVSEPEIIGRLFVHEGKVRPAILVLGGAEGGIEGTRAMATHLADLGYNVLALAYFGLPGIRPQLVKVPIEDFFHALDWLHQQPFVGASSVGILGCSKGAEATLLVAGMRDDLGVVIAYVPTHVVWECIDEERGSVASSWTRGGSELPFIRYKRLTAADMGIGRGWDAHAKEDSAPWQRATIDVNNNWGWDCLRDLHVVSLAVTRSEYIDRASIPVEKIRAPLLLFSGGRDLIWPSLTSANAIESRLKKMRSNIPFKSVTYPNAGHSLAGGSADGGGTESANRAAQSDSDRNLEMFLSRHLPLGTGR